MFISAVSIFVIWSLWKRSRTRRRTNNWYIKQKRVVVVDTLEDWEDVYPQLVKEIEHVKVRFRLRLDQSGTRWNKYDTF